MEPRENGRPIPCVALRVILDRSRQHCSDDVIRRAGGSQLDRREPNDLAKIAAGTEPPPHGALDMAVENAPRCNREARRRETRERLERRAHLAGGARLPQATTVPGFAAEAYTDTK